MLKKCASKSLRRAEARRVPPHHHPPRLRTAPAWGGDVWGDISITIDIKMNTDITDEPPADISGSVIPVVGIKRVFTPICTID